ncbi:hypothetical protein [Streptomyces sp. NPDC055189]
MPNDSDQTGTEDTAHDIVEGFPVGALVVDTARMRMGCVMGHEGPYLQLRPPGGGREWDADPARIREAMGDEILRATVHEVSRPAQERTP